MSFRGTACALIISFAAASSFSSYAAPPPPPPPPSPGVPLTLDGYDVGLIWRIYGSNLRNSVPIARANVFDALSPARDQNNLGADGEIAHRYILIEGFGDYVEGHTTAAVELVCFESVAGPGIPEAECITRLRVVGAVVIEQPHPMSETFNAQAAVANLRERGIAPDEVAALGLSGGELFGLSDAVDIYAQRLRFAVVDENSCPALLPHLTTLLDSTDLLVESQMPENGGRETPWPHTGWVSYQLTISEGDEQRVLSLTGYNQNPVMQATNAFLSGVAPCLSEAGGISTQ